MSASENERRVYTVGELNETIQTALRNSFPAPVWVRGEVQRLPSDAARRKHLYFELHDSAGGGAAAFQVPAALMEWDRRRFGLGAFVDGSDPGFQLRNQLEVCLQCQVDFYPPFGKLSLKVVGIDPDFTLGQLEARRREVLAWLAANELLERNAAIPMPELPLRVGLITSRGSAAERDFCTGLEASPWAFTVERIDCRMQGQSTETQIVAALAKLGTAAVDVIVITRGGGSRGDLSWFDQQGLAAAIAQSPLPVVTAIGHEIDTSIADVVAHTACKTPTAAAEKLVGIIDAVAARVDAAATRLESIALETVARATRRVESAGVLESWARRLIDEKKLVLGGAAARLESRLSRQVAVATRRLDERHGRLAAAARARLVAARSQCDILAGGLDPRLLLAGASKHGQRLESLAERLARHVPQQLATTAERLDHLAEKAAWLDPERLLRRGYSLTFDGRGRRLKSVADARPGGRLTTRLRDGDIESVVAGGRPAKKRKGNDGGEEEEGGQQSLFR